MYPNLPRIRPLRLLKDMRSCEREASTMSHGLADVEMPPFQTSMRVLFKRLRKYAIHCVAMPQLPRLL